MPQVLDQVRPSPEAPPALGAAVRIDGLSKSFGDVQAVDDVDLRIERGEIFSLLGPNGAGKSTLISMLSGLLAPSAGDATVMGHSIRTEPMYVKGALGLVPQDVALYPDLSAWENLMFWGRMYGLRPPLLQGRVAEMLEIVGLSDRQGRVSTFSGGMKRRLNIAAALLHRPELVIMDEPTAGIDPQSRRAILEHVKGLNRQGTTVLYTTHYMEEAQELSHRLAIMDQGVIIAEGTHAELVRIVGERDRISLQLDRPESEADGIFGDLAGVHRAIAEDDRIVLLAEVSDDLLPLLFEEARERGVRILALQVQEPNLEAVFLHLTGRALRE